MRDQRFVAGPPWQAHNSTITAESMTGTHSPHSSQQAAQTLPKAQHVQLHSLSEHQVQPADQQPPPKSPVKVQQAHQWIEQEGLESSIIDLVAYVDAVSAAKAKQAAHYKEQMLCIQQQHQASVQEQQILHQRLQEQSHQLQVQTREVERLQRLQPTSDNHYSHLYHELGQQAKVRSFHECLWLAGEQHTVAVAVNNSQSSLQIAMETDSWVIIVSVPPWEA